MLGTVGAASSVLGWPLVSLAGKATGRVVIVGGGFGGASCAKYLSRLAPGLEITLVERDSKFITCPFSNAVLGGLYDIDFITHGYDALQKAHGVKSGRENHQPGGRFDASL
jgi:sulfide dehydrogenase [flavocytochrome c] flavoprotein subunit